MRILLIKPFASSFAEIQTCFYVCKRKLFDLQYIKNKTVCRTVCRNSNLKLSLKIKKYENRKFRL